MTDQQLRELVREAIARQAGRETAPAPPPTARHVHSSQAAFPLSRGSDDEGACVIEPSVRCNHCGYCVAYGH